MKNNNLDTIIFDVGGVLHKNPVEDIKKDLASRFSLTIEAVDRAWTELIPNQLGRGKIIEEKFWNKFKDLTKCKEKIPTNLFFQLINNHFSLISKTLKIAEKLKESGYKLGIVSDNIKPFVIYAKKRGVFDSFDVTIFSCDVGYRKPEPEIFKIALERLDSKPEDSVFIDDVKEYVEAAKDMGMQGIVFSNPDQLAEDLYGLGINFSLYEFSEETRIGANAILVCDDGEIILQQRDNKPEIINPGTVSMFGGTLNKEENLLEGLRREIDEELGIDISKYELEKLNTYNKTKKVDGIDYEVHVYVLRNVDPDTLDVTEGKAVKNSIQDFLDSQKPTRITRLALEEYSRKK